MLYKLYCHTAVNIEMTPEGEDMEKRGIERENESVKRKISNNGSKKSGENDNNQL